MVLIPALRVAISSGSVREVDYHLGHVIYVNAANSYDQRTLTYSSSGNALLASSS